MATDYILFVHGVKTRREEDFQQLAGSLFQNIQRAIGPSRTLKPIYFFWGDLNQAAQQELLQGFQNSSKWNDYWFREFRTAQILEFVGDAALYLSRHVGSQVVRRFREQVLAALGGAGQDDRLHLVTHSFGTVILFDMLFAGRWDDPNLDQSPTTRGLRQAVDEIRNAMFGLSPNPTSGVPLASIHTMGSPISLFSLISISNVGQGGSSHDLSPRLKTLLQQLYSLKNQPLPWRNFAHPGDPIAYPLEGVMPLLLDENIQYMQIQDVITDKGNLFDRSISQTMAAILGGGKAHGSYWKNQTVSQMISDAIRASA
jgi:hypothetical protein